MTTNVTKKELELMSLLLYGCAVQETKPRPRYYYVDSDGFSQHSSLCLVVCAHKQTPLPPEVGLASEVV